MTPNLKSLALLTLAAALAGCGSTTTSTPKSTPGSPNMFLRGAVTASTSGQIVVTGVQVTTPPTVTMEGVTRPASDLRVGMIVTVKAHGSGHSAEGLEVQFEDALKGTVDSHDASTVTVDGQLVRIDDSTEFEDDVRRLSSISSGDRIRVSGVPDDKGGLRASRIDKTTDASHELELKGWVSDLTSTGFTLKLSPDSGAADTFTVTLAAGVTLPTGLANGAFVEVRSEQAVQAGNAILASGVVLEDGSPGESGQETEVEGIVTSGTSDQFVVAGTTVTTSSATRWDGGFSTDLAVGSRVEAEGVLGAGGVLAADRVSFKASARLIGTVSGKAGTGADVTFSVNGVPVKGDTVTDWRTAPDLLANGDWVEVRGQADKTGLVLVASRAEVKSPGNARPVLQGLLGAFDATARTATLFGKVVATDGTTEFHGQSSTSGVDGTPMTAADFFAALTAGLDVVKATGQSGADWSGGPSGFARSLELEGDK
jgi:hypothetical protein